MKCVVVADYVDTPTEGMNVVTRTLVDDLCAQGCDVTLVPPERVLRLLPRVMGAEAGAVVFTHGPGVRTVLASRLLRVFSRKRIVWVATRPDLAACPGWLRGRPTAHAVISNRRRDDLAAVAPDARVAVRPIGIAPERLAGAGFAPLWPELRRAGVPVAVHVGHLRPNRGLERLVEVKALLGDRIEVVVQASPHFPPAPGIVPMLEGAGIHVSRGFVPDIAQVYRSADLYLFPAAPDREGAIDLPLSVLEAVACRLPVITTRFGALPDWLEGRAGIGFASPGGFAGAVAEWLALPARQRLRPDGLPEACDAHGLARLVMELGHG